MRAPQAYWSSLTILGMVICIALPVLADGIHSPAGVAPLATGLGLISGGIQFRIEAMAETAGEWSAPGGKWLPLETSNFGRSTFPPEGNGLRLRNTPEWLGQEISPMSRTESKSVLMQANTSFAEPCVHEPATLLLVGAGLIVLRLYSWAVWGVAGTRDRPFRQE